MTRFGYVLDQRSCTGCHACTVACKQEHGVELKWLALARPASGELRRPIWLFRPVKSILAAYALPQGERTHAARAAGSERLGTDRFAEAVDWDPAEVWGPIGPAGDPHAPLESAQHP